MQFCRVIEGCSTFSSSIILLEFIEINVTFLCMLEHCSPVEADKLGPGFLSCNKQTNLNIQELFLEP